MWKKCLLSLLWLSCSQALALNENKDVHAFYYLWYGNPKTDGNYRHWDHEVLPHWTASVNRQFPEVGRYFDPANNNLHSPYYPAHGAYSSRDPETIKQHFKDLQRAKVSVISVSWWGQADKPESTDNQGVSTDLTVAHLLTLADETANEEHAISVCFHLEPYPGRSAESVLRDLEYINEKYGHHPSLARRKDGRVIFYVYDSYHIPATEWANILSPSGTSSIRVGGPFAHLNSFVLGLWLDHSHGKDLVMAGFDGFYTYFASDGFSFGSTSSNWKRMCEYAHENEILCTLSVGPGYQDDKIRPWNSHNTKPRRDGSYYDTMWHRAINAGAEVVSITSFNEWGEGTQIEPVDDNPPVPLDMSVHGGGKMTSGVTGHGEIVDDVLRPAPRLYSTYGSLGSYGYIDRTAEWVKKFRDMDI